jgi:hypothetical protein
MQQQDLEPTLELAALTRSQGFDLLGDVLGIDVCKSAAAQQPRLLFGPGVKVLLVKIVIGRHRDAFPPIISMSDGALWGSSATMPGILTPCNS